MADAVSGDGSSAAGGSAASDAIRVNGIWMPCWIMGRLCSGTCSTYPSAWGCAHGGAAAGAGAVAPAGPGAVAPAGPVAAFAVAAFAVAAFAAGTVLGGMAGKGCQS